MRAPDRVESRTRPFKRRHDTGIELRPAYSLIQGLLTDSAMIAELKRHGICIPHDVNQSVYTWISLLGRGYPLVKKSVLFELFEQKVERVAMTDLGHWIPENRRELLTRDIQQLFISRYSDRSPPMD